MAEKADLIATDDKRWLKSVDMQVSITTTEERKLEGMGIKGEKCKHKCEIRMLEVQIQSVRSPHLSG